MSMSSPSPRMPVLARLRSTRTRFGAPLATDTTSSMRSAPCEPASMSEVTPCERQIPGMSGVRACAWMSMRPGTTSFPVASMTDRAPEAAMPVCTAAMRLPRMATSDSATRSNPRDGSITRPPLNSRMSVVGLRREVRAVRKPHQAGGRRRAQKIPSRQHVGLSRRPSSSMSFTALTAVTARSTAPGRDARDTVAW